jgi:hypothetical protein
MALLPYRNPFRKVQGLTPERVDQGADYSGSGPVKALGTGRIVVADSSSPWPGGGFIAERLALGPAKGHYNYVAEQIVPTVHNGQWVWPWTTIGIMSPGPQGSGIETGWAASNVTNTQQSAAWQAGQADYNPNQDPGEHPTAYGQAYSQMLGNLGAPPAILSGAPVGTVPPWASKAAGSPGGGSTQSAQTTSFIGSVFSHVLSLLGVPDIKDLLQRFGLIVLGGIIVIVGLVLIAHENKEKLEQIITGKSPDEKEGDSDSADTEGQEDTTEHEAPVREAEGG